MQESSLTVDSWLQLAHTAVTWSIIDKCSPGWERRPGRDGCQLARILRDGDFSSPDAPRKTDGPQSKSLTRDVKTIWLFPMLIGQETRSPGLLKLCFEMRRITSVLSSFSFSRCNTIHFLNSSKHVVKCLHKLHVSIITCMRSTAFELFRFSLHDARRYLFIYYMSDK